MGKVRIPVRFLRKILHDIDRDVNAPGADGRAAETSAHQTWEFFLTNSNTVDAKRITGIDNEYHYDDIEFHL